MQAPVPESVRKLWSYIATHLGVQGLIALRDGLAANDIRLLQGATTSPLPIHSYSDLVACGADPIAYAFWQSQHLRTVGQLEDAWARTCYMVDQDAGEVGAIRWFLNWWDDTPRHQAFAGLAVLVKDSLKAHLTSTPLKELAR